MGKRVLSAKAITRRVLLIARTGNRFASVSSVMEKLREADVVAGQEPSPLRQDVCSPGARAREGGREEGKEGKEATVE